MQQDVAIPPLWQLNNDGMVEHCWHVEEYWLQSGEIFRHSWSNAVLMLAVYWQEKKIGSLTYYSKLNICSFD